MFYSGHNVPANITSLNQWLILTLNMPLACSFPEISVRSCQQTYKESLSTFEINDKVGTRNKRGEGIWGYLIPFMANRNYCRFCNTQSWQQSSGQLSELSQAGPFTPGVYMLTGNVTDTLEPWSLIPTSPWAVGSTQCIPEIDSPDILIWTIQHTSDYWICIHFHSSIDQAKNVCL